MRALDRNVAAASADHDRELAFIVEQARYAGHVDVVLRSDHARDLLVEEHRVPRRVHAGLGDVVGVVEPDGEVLPRPDRSQQPDLVQRIPFIGAFAIYDVAVLDDSGPRPGAGIKATESHRAASGISTGACSGA